MTKNEKRNYLGNIYVEDDPTSDNLAIALASYFEKHIDRPDEDPAWEDTEWGQWVIEKTNRALDRIAEATDLNSGG